VTFHVVEEVAQQGKISLTADEFKILFRIGSGRPLRQLVSDLGKLPVELYATLHNLEKNGLIAKGAGTPAPSAPRPVTAAGVAAPAPPPRAEPQRNAPPIMGKTDPGATALPPTPPPPPPPPPKAAAPPPPVPAADATIVTPREKPAAAAPAPEKPKTTLGRKIPFGSLTADDGSNVYPLMDDECTIGRDPSNKIAIQDGSISSNHARITRTAEGFFIEDAGSRNGTFVNGEKTAQKTKLNDNDVVRLGKVMLTFNIAKDAPGTDRTQFEMPVPK
jgi:pSer/pThr/pTyr-binding forkhead associated (FHA) protein